jgi:ABC-type transporter Mla subunit MlaD
MRLANLRARYANGGKRALVSSGSNTLTSTRTLTDASSEFGKNARESVEEFARQLDDAKDQTAEALHTAASTVRRTGRQSSAAIDNLATGTADRLDNTASYVDNHELSDVFNGLQKFGRRHLAGTVVFAAAIGFLAGAALHSAAHTCERTSERG